MKHLTRGFTLIELIIVIVITGIIGSVVGVFLKTPIDQFQDISRRAEMTDIADTALRRISRDIRTAVPNSLRIDGSYIEFLPTKAGGRYRAYATGGTGSCGSDGDELDFTSADKCFEIIGSPIDFLGSDYIILGNTQSDASAAYNTDSTGVLREYKGGTGSTIKVKIKDGSSQYPAYAQLPARRFQVISGTEQAVTYACENVGGTSDGTGTLRRYWNYGINATQVAPPVGGSSALLADFISACEINYSLVNQRNGLLSIRLEITQDNESISLYKEIHINNMP